MDDQLREKLTGLVNSHKIVLFMKGNRHQPACGFSARVVGVLQELELDYQTYDVFSDPDIRSGMKEFTQWPTFPQLYVEQEFVGGCDIVLGMNQTGELHQLLGIEREEVVPPVITISETMAGVLNSALQRYDGGVRLEISAQFDYDLGVGPMQPGDIEVVSSGIPFYMTRGTAKRANGIRLNYIDGPNGGVTIDNPNEPASVQRMDVQELAALRAANTAHRLLDVRTVEERALATIDGAEHFNAELADELTDLDKDTMLIFHCHHGMRSMAVAQQFLLQGFTNVHNLTGGIDAWSLSVDTAVPRY